MKRRQSKLQLANRNGATSIEFVVVLGVSLVMTALLLAGFSKMLFAFYKLLAVVTGWAVL